MKDPTRIPIILNLLRNIWEGDSDLRLGQLLNNILGPYSFYIEDDVLLTKLNKFVALRWAEEHQNRVETISKGRWWCLVCDCWSTECKSSMKCIHELRWVTGAVEQDNIE